VAFAAAGLVRDVRSDRGRNPPRRDAISFALPRGTTLAPTVDGILQAMGRGRPIAADTAVELPGGWFSPCRTAGAARTSPATTRAPPDGRRGLAPVAGPPPLRNIKHACFSSPRLRQRRTRRAQDLKRRHGSRPRHDALRVRRHRLAEMTSPRLGFGRRKGSREKTLPATGVTGDARLPGMTGRGGEPHGRPGPAATTVPPPAVPLCAA
jgi:hypothetical protein